MKVAVVGGGLTGLAAAYRLQTLGFEPTVYESAARVGGVVWTEREAGFLAETGPNSLSNPNPMVGRYAIEVSIITICVAAPSTGPAATCIAWKAASPATSMAGNKPIGKPTRNSVRNSARLSRQVVREANSASIVRLTSNARETSKPTPSAAVVAHPLPAMPQPSSKMNS